MALSNIIPLIILLIVVGVAAFVGYHMWLWSNELAERASKKLEKSNVSFRKDGGLRVGVKDIDNEKYTDTTQKVLTNVWNNAELPNFKSRLNWNSTQADPRKAQRDSLAPGRPSTSRTPSGSRPVS